MPIAARFYRSVYVTLGFACACLAYAEFVFLPEVVVFALAVGCLLVVAYRVEGKWSLSLRGANVLGAVIALGACLYVAVQFNRPVDTSFLPWPTSLLPYLGPLLMVLVPAKLFRPKHIGDYWGLHGIGLIAVALGCALAGDIVFGTLMLAYLISFIWSLTLFYYFRKERSAEATVAPAASPEPRLIRKAGSWALVGTALALVLFLVTPRLGEARWEIALRSSSLQTGLSEERPSIDLNHQGVVSVNRDLAFEVTAFAADGETPKLDLSPNQRWRNSSFNFYNNGRWEYRPDAEQRDRPAPPTRGDVKVDQPNERANPSRPVRDNDGRTPNAATAETPPPAPNTVFRDRGSNQLPYLGQSQYFLRFVPQGKAVHNAIVAEPVWKSPAGTPQFARQISVVTLGRNRQFAWFPGADDELAPPALGLVTNPMIYRQVMKPPKEENVSEPVLASDSFREHLCNLRGLTALRDWTQNLTRQMVANGSLPKEVLGAGTAAAESVRVPPEHSEAVARAFAGHLSTSGEFRYSLNLQRVDDSVDPAEDFLINSKIGHCNRFATALVLMLRSVGIPARIVLGYQGYETEGNGVYEVLQCHAHAWVEALIQRNTGGKTTWNWLTLNPTPQSDDQGEGGMTWSQWLEAIRTNVGSFFRFLIVDYDADQQGRARSWFERINWSGIGQATRRGFLGPDGTQYWRPVLLVAVIAGLWIAWRRRRARQLGLTGPVDATSALHIRMTRLFRRILGLAPETGQTPAEFADVASSRMASRPQPPADLTLPAETVAVYYRGRYGQQPATAGEQRTLADRWDRLEADLNKA